MRIVFMGTPEFAVAGLDKLYHSEIEIAGIVTAPDKPAGRGQKLKISPVKEFAVDKKLPLLQPVNLKDKGFLQQLKAWEADLFVIVAFRMLPREVWEMPPLGTINLHASLLPDYRGAAPINWAVINGERISGVTTFFINEVIDTGSVLFKEKVMIKDNSTAGDLHDELMEKGAGLLLKTVRAIRDGKTDPVPQDITTKAKEAPKLNKENTHINFHRDAREVYNLIRGLSPFPGAYTYLHQKDREVHTKILKAKVINNGNGKKPGSLETDNRSYLKVYCGKGHIEIEELQIAGKKRMSVPDLLNGFSFKRDAFFG